MTYLLIFFGILFLCAVLFTDSFFRTLGRIVEFFAISHLSNIDPEFKKKVEKHKKAEEDLDSYLRSKENYEPPTRAEKRAIAKGEYFK